MNASPKTAGRLDQRERTGTRGGRHGFWRQKWPALAALCVFILLEYWLHDSAPMDWMRTQSFEIIHRCLPLGRGDKLPLAIVDISSLPTTHENADPGSGPLGVFHSDRDYTSRVALADLLAVLGRLQPLTIGVCVDFSPEFDGSPPPPGQFMFLEACERLKDPSGAAIPVFVAVSRAAGRPPRAWLGAPSLTNLAACGLRFPGRSIRMPSTLTCDPDHVPLRSLSKALADTYLARTGLRPPEVPSVVNWLAESDKLVIGGKGKEDVGTMTGFLVNYSFLPALMQDRLGKMSADELNIPAKDPPEAREAKERRLRAFFKDKVVLIGDAQPGASYETAVIPGESDPLPSLYTHACAACTLIQSPLLEMGRVSGIVFMTTITFTLLVLNWLEWTKWLLSPRLARHLRGNRLEILHNFLAIAMVVGLAAGLAVFCHVLWLNSISSCAVFCAECYAALYRDGDGAST